MVSMGEKERLHPNPCSSAGVVMVQLLCFFHRTTLDVTAFCETAEQLPSLLKFINVLMPMR